MRRITIVVPYDTIAPKTGSGEDLLAQLLSKAQETANIWPGAISIGAGSGSSAQRGVACSQRGAAWTTKATKGHERHENLLAGKAPFRAFRGLS